MDREIDLEKYRPQTEADHFDQSLNFRSLPFVDAFQGRLPMASELEDMTKNLGVEMAATVFLKAVAASPLHGAFNRAMRAVDPRQFAKDEKDLARPLEVTLVPSGFMQSGRKWGEQVDSWRAWARELGFTTYVIETRPEYSIASNARLIGEYLAADSHPCRILITYGQGSAEFRYLLQRSANARITASTRELATEGLGRKPGHEVLADVKAWINVCGAFAGSSGVGILRDSRMLKAALTLEMKIRGRNPVTLDEAAPDFYCWKNPASVPPSMLVVNVPGVLRGAYSQGPSAPQSNSLSRRLMRARLDEKMPNDGWLTVLEAIANAGFVVPVLGMSHAAEDGKLEPVLKRVLALTARHFGNSALFAQDKENGDELSLVAATEPGKPPARKI